MKTSLFRRILLFSFLLSTIIDIKIAEEVSKNKDSTNKSTEESGSNNTNAEDTENNSLSKNGNNPEENQVQNSDNKSISEESNKELDNITSSKDKTKDDQLKSDENNDKFGDWGKFYIVLTLVVPLILCLFVYHKLGKVVEDVKNIKEQLKKEN